MQSLEVDGYTKSEVIDALHGASRRVTFRYELLDVNNDRQDDLFIVTGGNIENNSLANKVKRTAKFSMLDTSDIDFLSDRIRPWFQLEMPDGGFAEWPLGIFILSTPTRDVSSAGRTREVEAYDQLVILADDKVEDRYVVDAGTNYIDAVKTILDSAGINDYYITASSKTLPSSRDWSPGTDKREIINDLLSSVNYSSLHFNSSGQAVSRPYQRPSDRGAQYAYNADDRSVLAPELEVEFDLFEIANKWVATVSEADRDPITATYTNTNPDSPTSTESRGRTIVDFRDVDAADQESLDSMIERIAFEASQVYEIVDLETAIMPHHESGDIIEVRYPGADLDGKYTEHKWSMDLQAGAMMSHKLRRVVTV